MEQAAWSKLNQAHGSFVTHMDPHDPEVVERAWEDALLAMAEKIRGERAKKFWEKMAALVFPDGVPGGADSEKKA